MCVFCDRIASGDLPLESELAAVFPDGFPVSPGHMLIVSRRHVADYFSLEASEQAALWELAPAVKRLIEREHLPSGYNMGINIGTRAGQTIEHVHLHVIPRYEGDVPDPRGGIRWVIPARAAYWAGERAKP